MLEIKIKGSYFWLEWSPLMRKHMPLRNVPSVWDHHESGWKFPINLEVASQLEKLVRRKKAYLHEDAVNIFQDSLYKRNNLYEKIELIEGYKKNGFPMDRPSYLRCSWLYPEQQEAHVVATELPYSALLMEQGTGKSVVSVGVIGHRIQNNLVDKIFIVCDNSMVYVWEEELEDKADFPYTCEVLDQAGSKKKNKSIQSAQEGVPHIIIVNYESSWRIAEAILEWGPQMMLLDESHYIKNRNSNQSKGCVEIGKSCKYRMILTGTPVSDNPLHFWAQFEFLCPGYFGKYSEFEEEYYRPFKNAPFRGKFKNLDKMNDQVYKLAYRFTKDDSGMDLPPKLPPQKVYFNLDADTRKIYDSMDKNLFVEINDREIQVDIALAKLSPLQRITSGHLYDKEADEIIPLHDGKLKLLKSTIEQQANHEKLIVICRYTEDLNQVQKVVEGLGRPAIRYDGQVTKTKRQKAEARKLFNSTTEPAVMVAQIRTVRTGITMVGSWDVPCRTMIFFSSSFSLTDYEQVQDRIHRIGQKWPVNLIHLIARGTLDEDIFQAYVDKKRIADYVVDKIRSKEFDK